MTTNSRVVVVGAGLAGLATACHLAGRGHQVTVVERGEHPGGRMGVLDVNGWRMDTGPTVLTMVGILAQTFAAAGADIEDHLDLHPVDPMYRACFADGTEIRVRHGRDAMTEEIRSTCGQADATSFGRFCDWLTELYQLELPNFIDRNFDSPFDLARPVKPLVQLVRLGGLRKLAKAVSSYFEDDRLQKLFSFQSMYAGLSPFEALALYAVITYMDTVEGVWFPEGGMHTVAEGLALAAEKAGAAFRYGAAVERVTPGRPVRVHLADGSTISADAVVLNPDLPGAYRDLLGLDPPRVARRGNYSPSCVVWLAGVRGSMPAGSAHHNIHFARDWSGAFDALMKQGIRMPDPSILVTAPPVEPRYLYVLEPVPNLDGRVDWSQERDRVRAELAARVAHLGYPTDVEVEQLTVPTDWAAAGMERGTPFALSHRFFQTGPFRPNNIDRRLPGVVFTGSGTLPGVGVPMVLLSGRLAAERVEQLT